MFERVAHECEKLPRAWIIVETEGRVDLVVVDVVCTEDLYGKAGILQYGAEAECLRGVVGVAGQW